MLPNWKRLFTFGKFIINFFYTIQIYREWKANVLILVSGERWDTNKYEIFFSFHIASIFICFHLNVFNVKLREICINCKTFNPVLNLNGIVRWELAFFCKQKLELAAEVRSIWYHSDTALVLHPAKHLIQFQPKFIKVKTKVYDVHVRSKWYLMLESNWHRIISSKHRKSQPFNCYFPHIFPFKSQSIVQFEIFITFGLSSATEIEWTIFIGLFCHFQFDFYFCRKVKAACMEFNYNVFNSLQSLPSIPN